VRARARACVCENISKLFINLYYIILFTNLSYKQRKDAELIRTRTNVNEALDHKRGHAIIRC